MPRELGYKKPPHIGRASELTGKDRVFYRLLEIVPGFLAWGTIIGCLAISYFSPFYAAIFIIIFDFYWLLKTLYFSIYLRQNWRRMRHNQSVDWSKMLSNLKYEHIYHLVLLPFFNEDSKVISKCIESLIASNYDKKRILVVLAAEARVGEPARRVAEEMSRQFNESFGAFLITSHPSGIPGEMNGKGSNITHAIEEARKKILNVKTIPYENVVVSAFDVDTVVYKDYFSCVTWNFLTSDRPFRTSFQPVPLYNNNIWDAPALSRVVATSGTFWQMIQQERPEKLATFSSHSVSFQTLYEIGYWQKNMVSEDSRIFWNAFIAYNGDYAVTPLSYPVSMDANLAPTFWQTMKNIYKQQRRWGWGVENVPYIIFCAVKNKKIKLWKKIKVIFVQIEGFWSLSTNPIIIFLLGWAPLWLGGAAFNATILSYNLPVMTRDLMLLAMSGLIFSAIISMSFLPKIPKHKKIYTRPLMIIQWILVPITITLFGSIPGLEAQTRLMFGRYMGFWITPKHRVNAK